MTVLVTGGAGYIGSHMTYALLARGEEVVVFDNLGTGQRSLIAKDAHFMQGNVGDVAVVRRTIQHYGIDAVIHFAGSIIVPESVDKPLAYYANNTVASRGLIEACVESGVKKFIFSSTAAVYGTPKENPVTEEAPLAPINPYGRSKLMTEWMLEDTARAHDFRYVALRYFNVAGADGEGRTGQVSQVPTHLIKRACLCAVGKLPHLDIFGTDYATPDGTGVRDYIHVTDLADAHLRALDYLSKDGPSLALNCGYGHGYSVREVVDAMSRVLGRKIPTVESPRRAGDADVLVADSSKLKARFGWTPKHDSLDEIIATAYAWEKRQSGG